MPSLSFGLVFALALTAIAGFAPPAHAHGRYPELGRITFHPTDDDIFLVRGTFGLVATRDGGATFEWICPTAFDGRWTEDPAITIAEDGSFVVGVFNGLARGTGGGCDWSVPSTDLGDVVVIDVARTPDATRLFALESSGGRPNGLWTSTDSGATWAATNPAIDPILFETMRVAPSDAMRIYLTGAYPPSTGTPRRPFVYASDDGGVTFDSVAFTDFVAGDRNVYLLGVDPLDSDRLLIHVRADTDDRVYESTDRGATFTEIFSLPRLDAFAWSDDGTTAWIGSSVDRALYRSTDGGRSFDLLHDDLWVSCLGTRGNELWVCADNFADGYALGRSTDNGVTIDPVFVFADIGGIVECPASASTPMVCAIELEDLVRDLGLPVDGGVVDGGPGDASVDSGLDAGMSDGATDGGTTRDGSRRDSSPYRAPEPDGCSCRVGASGGPSGRVWVLAIALVFAIWRRRVA